MSSAPFVHVIVGGLFYSIALSDIEKFPESFFACMIKKEWMKDGKPISIDRDGTLFKYVNAFLVNGHLPRNERGKLTLDEETLAGVKQEADFFGLDALSEECTIDQKESQSDLEGYLTIRKYIDAENYNDYCTWTIDYSSELAKSLKETQIPFCVSRKLPDASRSYRLERYSKKYPTREEWTLAAAEALPNSLSIPASELDAKDLKSLASRVTDRFFPPYPVVELKPRELEILHTGYESMSSLLAVREDGQIGTLILILNSEYTGGELEVSHGGHTEVVTGTCMWAAMYGDCEYKINPVTSGLRACLVYDIIGTPPLTGLDEDIFSTVPPEDVLFWDFQSQLYPRNINFKSAYKPVDASLRTTIHDGVSTALQSNDSMIITLQHLYPECQNSPAFLKGGDRTLYDLLTDQYDVTVVALNIRNNYYPSPYYKDDTKCTLFSPANMKRAIKRKLSKSYLDEEPDEHWSEFWIGLRMYVVILSRFDQAGLLQSSIRRDEDWEYISEFSRYIVSGLQLHKRAV